MKYKINIVNTPELSTVVQRHAFKLGYKWKASGKTVRYTNAPFLYLDEHLTFGGCHDSFANHPHEEISASDFLALTPTPKGVKSYKVRVGNNPELSELIQKHALTIGYTWWNDKKVKYTEQPFLLFRNGDITFLDKEKDFAKATHEEISVPDFLELGNKKLKFGCQTLEVKDGHLKRGGKSIHIHSGKLQGIIQIYQYGHKTVDVLGHKVGVSKGKLVVDGTTIDSDECEALIAAISADKN